MFNFNNPYTNQNHQPDNDVFDFETLQKARQDLIGEIQAVIEYDAHIHNTKDQTAIKTWESIKNEELIHIGELLGLINYLDENQRQYVLKGLAEFNDILG